jgi:hypothetical protein
MQLSIGDRVRVAPELMELPIYGDRRESINAQHLQGRRGSARGFIRYEHGIKGYVLVEHNDGGDISGNHRIALYSIEELRPL